MEVPVSIRWSEAPNLRQRLQQPTHHPRWYQLYLAAQALNQNLALDGLQTLEQLQGQVDPHPYQMEVALNVLQQKGLNALLADEVGLGKTIEAGLIMKEALSRGWIDTILLIVPPALIPQWQEELLTKFGERFTAYNPKKPPERKTIVSYGKLVNQLPILAERQWDLVVADEAHLLANPQSQRRQAVAGLPRRHTLLITATPLQNRLLDLYSLIDLIFPGLLGSPKAFLQLYAQDGQGRKANNATLPLLRSQLNRVVCRTRREEAGIPFAERHVETRKIEAHPAEYRLNDLIIAHLKTLYRQATTKRQSLYRELLSLHQSLSSHPTALIKALKERQQRRPDEPLKELIAAAKTIQEPAKERLLKEIVSQVINQQALIFVARRETARHLTSQIKNSDCYLGGDPNRHTIIKRFQDQATQFLICTDAAAEGLNLQSANLVINYDLHWNPMRLEQRIGRVHRFGQNKDVTVLNLCVKNTIEEKVLEIVGQKLNLFRNTLGGLEAVIAEVQEGDQDLETFIIDLLVRSQTARDIEQELAKLGEDLERAARKQQLAEQFSRGVLG